MSAFWAPPWGWEETDHTRLVARVRARVERGIQGSVDGFSVLRDMAEMVKRIEGRGQRPAPRRAPNP